MFRLGQWLSAVLLLGAWGQTRFAVFAAAIAGSQWLTAVASAGAEKTLIALAPLPNGSAVRRRLLAWMSLGLVVVVGLTAALTLFEGRIRPWPVAMVYGASVGALLVAVAALRLARRMWPDLLAMSAIGLAHVLAAGLALVGQWPVVAVLSALAGVAALAATLTLLAAWRLNGGATGTSPRSVHLVREMSLTGASEVCNMLAVAVVYAILASTRHAQQAADLYVASMVGQVAIGAVAYLMRLSGGALAVAGPVAAGVESAAASRFRTCAMVTAPHLAVVAGLLATPLPDRVLVSLATLLAVPPTLLVLRASAWAEFSAAAGRRASATAAVAGLLTAVGLASFLIGITGATGGIISLLAGIGVQSLVAGHLLRKAG
ncbi:hypothetical protein [Kribbella deserti]|uniref:O-antigen/teichoic acid export membrane protein n=1 Tax=Kribbella deserti TaxID=1926257 RepID=A0ABV6QGY1_9ACTN